MSDRSVSRREVSQAPAYVDEYLLAIIQDAVEAERAERARKRKRSPMFEAARSLRWCNEFQSCDDQQAANLVERGLRMLNPNAQDPWSATFPDHEDPKTAFMENWNVIKFPVGTFDKAVLLAKTQPARLAGAPSETFNEFLSICYHLQKLNDRLVTTTIVSLIQLAELSPPIAASCTPPWLPSGWGCRDRRLSRG